MMPTLRSQQRQDKTSKGQKRRVASSDDIREDSQDSDDIRPPKKQKCDHRYFPPAKFWDGLSNVPLTQNAIRELDRRNQSSNHSPGRVPTIPTPQRPSTIKRFARQGGPNLSAIRGLSMTRNKTQYNTDNNKCRIPSRLYSNISSSQSSLGRRKRGSQLPVKTTSKSSSKTNAAPNSATTRNTGLYDRAFQQNLIDHNVFPDGYEYPDGTLPPEPSNIHDILQAMAQPRPSLSSSQFSNDDFRKFKRADTHAFKECGVRTNVILIIEGKVADSKCVAGDVAFTNLDDLTDGTLVTGKPDLYYGARPEHLHARLRREQSGKIIPSSQTYLPCLANFFVEVKGPDGNLAVGSRQSCYNGALGARGMHSLQSYNQSEPEYDNKAYTISSTYHGGTLKMYTSHPIPPRTPEGRPGFVTTQIKTWGLTGDADTFRQGTAAFRNARDWAKKQRDAAIQQANERAVGGETVARCHVCKCEVPQTPLRTTPASHP